MRIATIVVVTVIGVSIISIAVFGPYATDRAAPVLANAVVSSWRNPLCALHLTRGYSCQHCSLHNLDQNFQIQLTASLSNKSIALIGDSRIRYLFAYVRSLVDGRYVILKKSRLGFNGTLYWDAQRNIQLAYYIRRYPDEAMRALLHEWSVSANVNGIPHYVIMETGAVCICSLYPNTPVLSCAILSL
ncbi:uncharacterized protein LOC129582209 isoform X2 [Paramacrobiotus metropolitanus]|uniref:uncharacterized protein LOC129582209 isoform X2 n=1 Tax=Paramacrobiotus metropolitanus TaxID=2943436 RepID=UPI0024462DEC|nr:uncharacterized protein LOC129582209 isoform X2 [Paramacrobiotus metropolitanus]